MLLFLLNTCVDCNHLKISVEYLLKNWVYSYFIMVTIRTNKKNLFLQCSNYLVGTFRSYFTSIYKIYNKPSDHTEIDL